jgi:hypothetical protein
MHALRSWMGWEWLPISLSVVCLKVLGNRKGGSADTITMSKKLLVVEDHAVLLELLGKGLALLGWDTVLPAAAWRR